MGNKRSVILSALETALFIVFCIFILAVPFNKFVTKGAAVAVFFFWILRAVVNTRTVSVSAPPLSGIFFMFIASSTLSTFLSVNFPHSVTSLLERYIPYIIFFLVSYSFVHDSKRDYLRWLVFVFLLSGIVVGIGTIFDIVTLSPYRLFSSFGKSVFLTGFLPFFFPIAFAIMLHEKKRLLRVIATACFFLLLPALISHGSRLIWITFELSLLFVCFLHKKTRLLALFVLLTSAVAIVTVPQIDRHRVKTLLTPFSRQTLSDRVDLTHQAVAFTLHHPYFGSGPGTFGDLYKPPAGKERDITFIHGHAHNTYLEVSSETGIFGLIFFIGIFFSFFRHFLLIRSRAKKTALIYGLTGSIFAILMTSFGCSTILVGLQDSLLFWFFLACAMSCIVKTEEQLNCCAAPIKP